MMTMTHKNLWLAYMARLYYLALIAILSACIQSSRSKSPKRLDYNQELFEQMRKTNAKSLLVTKGKIVPILIGRHQSVRLDIDISTHADYAWYEVQKDGTNNLLKNGKVYLGPALIHDLPEGLMHFRIWACKEKDVTDTLLKENCGRPYQLRYYQPLNTDQELIKFLKEREGLIDKQKDIGEQLVSAVREYRQETQDEKPADTELEDFIEPIEEAGPGKVGDIVAKSPGIEQEEEQSSFETVDNEGTDSDGTEGPLSFSNGVALLYIVGTGVQKLTGKQKSSDSIKVEYEARMEALNGKIKAAVEAKGDYEKNRTRLEQIETELRNFKGSDPSESLLRQKEQLVKDVDESKARFEAREAEYNKLLKPDLIAAPTRVNIWLKRAGTMTALVGAGLILFTSFDEGLLGRLDRFLEKMIFALSSEGTSAQLKLRKALERIAVEYNSLKDQVFQIEQRIDLHLKNASKS